MEIGLKAIRISAGFTELFEINGDSSWTSKVRDVRSDLECIDNIQLSKEYLMLTNIDEGFLLSIVIPISGRKGDCVNVWLFIPKDVEDTTCVEKIIEEVVSQFGSGRFNREKLQEVVDKCGAKKSSADRIVNQSKGDVVAYRVFKNEAERRKLLGALNQKYYANYKMVMFLREEDKAVQRCVDLTSKKIKEEVVVEAPQPVEGFKPHIYDKSFGNDMWLEKGSEVIVIWKRENYNDIQKSLQVGVGEVDTPKVKYLSEYTITCKINNPWKDIDEKVTLNNGNSFEYRNNDYDLWITVGEKKEKYSSNNRYIITENNSLRVQIVYKDYLEEKETVLNLDLNEQQEIKINMKKREELKIEDKIFVLKSDKDDMSFKNFEVKELPNGTKELVKDKPKKKVESESKGEEPKVKDTKVEWLWRLVSFFVGVLVAVLVVLAGILLLDNQNVRGSLNSFSTFSENKSTAAPKDTSDVNVACIKYLKNNLNEGWSKDSLDSYSLTRGLYDAMINYDFDKMKCIFDQIYIANNKFTLGGESYMDIVNWVNANKDSKKEKFKDKKFDVGSENKINLKNYLEKLNEISDNKSKPSDKKQPKTIHAEKKDSVESPMAGEDRNKEF